MNKLNSTAFSPPPEFFILPTADSGMVKHFVCNFHSEIKLTKEEDRKKSFEFVKKYIETNGYKLSDTPLTEIIEHESFGKNILIDMDDFLKKYTIDLFFQALSIKQKLIMNIFIITTRSTPFLTRIIQYTDFACLFNRPDGRPMISCKYANDF